MTRTRLRGWVHACVHRVREVRDTRPLLQRLLSSRQKSDINSDTQWNDTLQCIYIIQTRSKR